MRSTAIVVATVAMCAFLACSPRDFLTRRLAGDLISACEPFRAPQDFVLTTGVLSNKDFDSPENLILQRRGWIIGTQQKCPPGVDPPPCWDVVLSPAGVDVFKSLIPGPPGRTVTLHVARRELVAVTGISKAGNFADVDFLWHWSSLNEVGAALYDSGARYRSNVAFRRFDDGWRVETDQFRSNQSVEDAMRNAQPAQ
jgi:hypothetical protein